MDRITAKLAAMTRRPFRCDDAGATATEYAVLLGFIAVVIGIGIAFFGGQLNQYWVAIGSGVGGFL